MADKMVEVYDTRTGQKLPQRVPAVWLKLYKYLAVTPKHKARIGATTPKNEEA